MKLGVFSVLFQQLPLEAALDRIAAKGLEAVEIGTGGYPGTHHCKPDELLGNQGKLKAFKQAFDSRGLTISALSCHGNPLHPNQSVARQYHEDFMKTLNLAEQLEVPVVVGFSGCPGDSEQALYPNWPVAPWPNEYGELLAWQWDKKVIPYWSETAKVAGSKGLKIALELHGGFSVHSPATLLKLREATSEVIGANLDPSHMWWQGIDPVQAIHILGEANALHYFHAKDTSINQANVNRYGITDMQPYTALRDRAWNFRSVGYGHDQKTWSDMMSALRLVGYDYVVSIEHEDGLMSVEEGFAKAVAHLQPIIMKEMAAEMWWT
jgi:sugar phosphate isomerase/epimerase